MRWSSGNITTIGRLRDLQFPCQLELHRTYNFYNFREYYKRRAWKKFFLTLKIILVYNKRQGDKNGRR